MLSASLTLWESTRYYSPIKLTSHLILLQYLIQSFKYKNQRVSENLIYSRNQGIFFLSFSLFFLLAVDKSVRLSYRGNNLQINHIPNCSSITHKNGVNYWQTTCPKLEYWSDLILCVCETRDTDSKKKKKRRRRRRKKKRKELMVAKPNPKSSSLIIETA
jgi:hypothetical protein